MQQQATANIYLANNYPIHQTINSRSISVLDGHTLPVNNLNALRDETLAGGCTIEYEPDAMIMILPVVGTIIVSLNEKETALECGEALLINSAAPIIIANPYAEYLVNYLLISFTMPFNTVFSSHKYSFDLNSNMNELLTVYTSADLGISIGKFGMRKETIFHPAKSNQAYFCFVIQGSFEIAGRLLHERDALAIWDISELDIESLGKESIILLIEQSVTIPSKNYHTILTQ